MPGGFGLVDLGFLQIGSPFTASKQNLEVLQEQAGVSWHGMGDLRALDLGANVKRDKEAMGSTAGNAGYGGLLLAALLALLALAVVSE